MFSTYLTKYVFNQFRTYMEVVRTWKALRTNMWKHWFLRSTMTSCVCNIYRVAYLYASNLCRYAANDRTTTMYLNRLCIAPCSYFVNGTNEAFAFFIFNARMNDYIRDTVLNLRRTYFRTSLLFNLVLTY